MTAPQPPFNIVNPAIDTYLERLYQSSDEPVLVEMERLASKRSFPIVGRLVGPFLETMALTIQAKRIFEFGSGFGYSAYWFSKAVGDGGTVICCDQSAENCRLAEEFLKRVNRWQRVEYHQALAQQVFAQQSGEFDLIFNDADKNEYPEIFELSKSKLRKGGLYLADNVLWDGQVVPDKADEADDWTAAIIKHNRLVAADPDFRFFINPTRDGLLAAIKC